jgi:hypothetical protein
MVVLTGEGGRRVPVLWAGQTVVAESEGGGKIVGVLGSGGELADEREAKG